MPVEVHGAQVLPAGPRASLSVGAEATTEGGSAPPGRVEGDGVSNNSGPGPATTADDNAAGRGGTQIGSLHSMSLAFLLQSRSSAIVWRGPKKTAMVRQFLTSVLWPPVDYLLIDTPPGTSDEHISLAETLLQTTSASASASTPNGQQVAGAVVVTTPQAVAISDVRKEMNFCAKVGVRVLGVVENMSGYVCECCGTGTNLFGRGGGEVMSGEFGVEFLGRVALDAQWGRLVEEGRRPRYGGVRKRVEAGDGEGDGEAEEDGREEGGDGDGVEMVEERDEGLLVDKYRSCSLCATFEGIARRVVEIVEGGSGGSR